jgi:hypothetical protein
MQVATKSTSASRICDTCADKSVTPKPSDLSPKTIFAEPGPAYLSNDRSIPVAHWEDSETVYANRPTLLASTWSVR